MNGKLQWHRASSGKNNAQLFLNGPKESLNWGQQPWYLPCIGWFIPDPTEHGEKSAAPQKVTYPDSLFAGKPYKVAETIETVDGARCVVLHTRHDETHSAYGVSEVVTLDETLWLDLDHGLALKQRNTASARIRSRDGESRLCRDRARHLVREGRCRAASCASERSGRVSRQTDAGF